MSVEISENMKIAILFKKEGKELDKTILENLKLKEVKSKNGDVLMYDGDTPQQGMPVQILTPEGNYEMAPDGKYELEYGSIIEVVAGLIASVTPAATNQEGDTPPQGPPMESNEFTPAQAAAVKRTVESVVKETHFSKEEVEEKIKPFTELIEKFSASEKTFNEKFEAQEKTIIEQKKLIEDQSKKITTLIELLQAKPATQPASGTKTAFASSNSESDYQTKLSAYLKTIE